MRFADGLGPDLRIFEGEEPRRGEDACLKMGTDASFMVVQHEAPPLMVS
ncbi:hypothetical protein [Pseudarthrobacter sp. NamE5]|nr:hypothetical protein [Pseudarthrobacter sp. NamE5]